MPNRARVFLDGRAEQRGDAMTLDHVRAEVERIASMAGDDEIAHGAEDNLHVAVLYYYANGGTDKKLAIAALQTLKIDFARWCA